MRAVILALAALGTCQAQKHACQIKGEAFVAKCDTNNVTGSSCPTGCLDAYKAFKADTSCAKGWTEVAGSGGLTNLTQKAMNQTGRYGWGNYWPNETKATLNEYAVWGSLVHKLHDRCEFQGQHGTCNYHYKMALETVDIPGEVLGYNCAAIKGRETCSSACKSMYDKAEKHCGSTDTYKNSRGHTVDYKGMMGVLELRSACHSFTCNAVSLGNSFCSSLDELHADPTLTGLINLACDMTLQSLNALSKSQELLEMPYRAMACFETLSTGKDKDIKSKDICACVDKHKCPNDKRTIDQSKCVKGVYPEAPPPAPPPAAPAGSGGMRVAGVTAAAALIVAAVMA